MISAKASLDVPHSTSCVTHVEWRIWTQVHAFASTDPQAHPLGPRTTSMQLINIDNKWFETQLNIIKNHTKGRKNWCTRAKEISYWMSRDFCENIPPSVWFTKSCKIWKRYVKKNIKKQHFFLIHIDLYWSHWFTRHLVKKYKLLWVLHNIVILCCSWIALVFY